MKSKQMHWTAHIVLIAMLLPLISSCSGKPQEGSTATEVSSGSAQSISATQSMSSSSSASQSKSVTYSNATIEDVPVPMVIDGDYLYQKELDAYNAEMGNPEPDYLKMVNNDAPLSDLLRTNRGTVSSGGTLSLSNSCYNPFWALREDLDPAAVYQVRTVNWVQKLIGFDVAFTRSTGEFFDENRKEQAIRMYTVFESEMGGYIYCFFNYYPESRQSRLRSTVYQPIPVDYEDISGIKGGENVKNLVQIRPFTLRIQRIVHDEIQGLNWCVILLSDHTTFSVFFDFEGNAYSPQILKQNQADNPFTEVAEGMIETVGDYTSPWNIYDFTILPEDYPPA